MITIRPVEESDLETLYSHQSDPVALEMAVFGARDREAFMKHWDRIWSEPSNITYAALVDGQLAGDIMFWMKDGRRYLGYWIGREFWGRGVATEAVRQTLEEIRDRPMYAWVALTNKGSVRVLEMCIRDSPDIVTRHPHTGGHPFEERDERGAMGFTCGQPAQHAS